VGHEKQNLDRRLTHTHVAVYADSKDFPKNSSFFHTIKFNQAKDVCVNIYETAQLTMFYVF
jgi:hypothetical protein